MYASDHHYHHIIISTVVVVVVVHLCRRNKIIICIHFLYFNLKWDLSQYT